MTAAERETGVVAAPRCNCPCHTGMATHVAPCKCEWETGFNAGPPRQVPITDPKLLAAQQRDNEAIKALRGVADGAADPTPQLADLVWMEAPDAAPYADAYGWEKVEMVVRDEAADPTERPEALEPGREDATSVAPGDPLADIRAKVLDATVRAHFDALHAAGLCLPYDEISDRTKRIVGRQVQDTVNRAVDAVAAALDPEATS